MAGNQQGGTNIPGRVCSSERSIAAIGLWRLDILGSLVYLMQGVDDVADDFVQLGDIA